LLKTNLIRLSWDSFDMQDETVAEIWLSKDSVGSRREEQSKNGELTKEAVKTVHASNFDVFLLLVATDHD